MNNKIHVKLNLPDKEIAEKILENAITDIICERIDSIPIEDRIKVYDRILDEINYDSY